MMDEPEPEPEPPKIKPMKRDEKICVGSFVVNIISWAMTAGLAIAIAGSGSTNLRPFLNLFSWILVLSLIPICAFICNRLRNWDSDRMNRAMERARVQDRR
jgi:4-hydroxybenzoate polyprenyltransferase